MIDPIGSKAVLADPSVRKAPKADAKASATAPVKIADASVSAKADTPQVEVTITKGNGLSEPPFDYAKVIALKQQIAMTSTNVPAGSCHGIMNGGSPRASTARPNPVTSSAPMP